MIFVSTTFPPQKKTDLDKVLDNLKKLDIDGIEIGSTHNSDTKKNFKNIIKNSSFKRVLIHNFFPPHEDKNFVINIASNDNLIRKKSVDCIINNIDFCQEVDSELYTFHPGFLSESKPSINFKKNNYDFNFSSDTISLNKATDNMITSLKKIVPYSKKKQIKIALETEGSIRKKNYLILQKPIEFDRLFKVFPKNLLINFNLSHSYFASKVYKFSLRKLILKLKKKIYCVELSDNNGIDDQHLSLKENTRNLMWIKYFNDIPKILEFRNSTILDIKRSIKILKNLSK